MQPQTVIAHTKNWIVDVVVGCNLCPFAGREVQRNSIYYEVVESGTLKKGLENLARVFAKMDDDANIETALLIFPDSFALFNDYLQLVEVSEKLLKTEGYEGIYQVASFHPLYLFAGASENDPANYTNRSPYPMLHLLREESVTNAIEWYGDTEKIPEQNITFAQQKGLAQMKLLRLACMKEM